MSKFFNFGQIFVLNTTNLKFESIYFHVKLINKNLVKMLIVNLSELKYIRN